MINANEARAKTVKAINRAIEEEKARLNAFLEVVGNRISTAAENGENQIYLSHFEGTLYDLFDRLEDKGYNVKLVEGKIRICW